MPLLIMPSPSSQNAAKAFIHSDTATGRALLAQDAAMNYPSGSRFPSGFGSVRDQAIPGGQAEVSRDQHEALRRACADCDIPDDIVERLIASLAGQAADQPPPFHGMPTPGGGQLSLNRALDAMPKRERKALRRRLAEIGSDKLAYDAKRQRDIAPSSADMEAFYSRVPGARRIGILG
jgi:hypothetical protein